MWFKRKAKPAPEPVEVEADTPEVPRRTALSTHNEADTTGRGWTLADRLNAFAATRPSAQPVRSADGTVSAMDASDEGDEAIVRGYGRGQPNMSDALTMWYASQSFIGHQLAALVSQHWLVGKACAQPALDATRNGFNITTADGEELTTEMLNTIKRADKAYGLTKNLVQYLHMGRVFGIRICIFKVDYGSEQATKEAYEAPFNIDGVKPGSYRGMSQVDPYWCSPEMDAVDAAQPDSMHFYEPTWWLINGQRYHRTHLAIFRNGELPDILKPAYQYGGIPVPQLIMERVYGAERTANEAPLLALTKRTTVYKTDTAQALLNWGKFNQTLQKWSDLWNNKGVRAIGLDDEISQIDTSLSDLDAVIMTQYQLVAASANVPATKLLGTSPKGFGASGEYEEASYHEELESLQTHILTPLIERHHMLVIKSGNMQNVSTSVAWKTLDTPTAKEAAEIDKLKAERDAVLVTCGALDGPDVRERLGADDDGDYGGIDIDKEIVAPELPLTQQ